MKLRWRWRIRTLMLLILIAAVVFFGDLMRRRRAYFLEQARAYAVQEKLASQTARDRVAWAEQMQAKGYVSVAQLEADRLALEKAELSAQQAASGRLRRKYEYAAAHPWINISPEPPANPR